MNNSSLSREALEQKNVRELLRLLTDTKRIQKAQIIYTSDIKIVFQSDEGDMYEMKGAKQTYFLRIDWKNKVLIHNCEDWLHRSIRDYKLCKHFVKIFLLLYKKDAKKILVDLLLHSWRFLDSDDYLKSV